MADRSVFLLVEDDENDVILVRRAFSKSQLLNPLAVVRNAEEAMAYFMGIGAYKNRSEYPLPSLVLLDLKMPGMSGIEFLQWLRQQPGYGSTRVVILTSSSLTRDVNAAYQAGANSFLIKPVDFERFVEITSALSGYWMRTDVAPETQRPFTQSSVEQKKR
jgi:CheY-like chemotaxis protein